MKRLMTTLVACMALLPLFGAVICPSPYDYTVFVPRAKDDVTRSDPTKIGDLVNEHFTVVDNPRTGSLLAFWTQETWEASPDMHIAFSRSPDGGKTWSPARVLWGSPTLKSGLPNAKWQIPMVSKSGRVYCFWNQNDKPGGGMGAGLMMGASSDDDGLTWSEPVRMKDGPAGFWCVWQRPMRFASGNRFLTAISIAGEKVAQTCFLRFENIDDDPEVKDVRFTVLGRDKTLEGEEASIVKLPDGRLFAVMRSRFGHPFWTESRDGGETWSDSKPVKDASGKVIAHPRAPCPMYDLGGDAAASGNVFALFCDAFDPKLNQWRGRGPLYFYRGTFDSKGEQPVRFEKGELLLRRDGRSHYGNSCYSSFTVRNGERVLWYPDEKFCLFGVKVPHVASSLPAPAPAVMHVLPLGSVKAEGWLLKQLEKQRDGLTGHAEELYDDIGKSDWLAYGDGAVRGTAPTLRGGQYAWERGPYYAKGLVALALVLDDPTLKARAKRWIDSVLASQRPDGDFGPKKNSWWANMIALHFLRDWAEATGDGRIMPFLERYFDYQLKTLPGTPLFTDAAWAKCRVGDELEVLLWLYGRTQDARLLELAHVLCAQAADWTSYYHDGGAGDWELGYRVHIVNFMQGLKYPALLSRLTGDERDRTAYAAAFDPTNWAMRQCGRVDRMLNGTEPLTTRLTTEGTELCAIAERMLSCRDVVAATGEIKAADDLEVVAFNSLPAALGDDGKGCRYYLLLNQPQCVDAANLGYHCNPRGDASTPSPDPGFGCCRSNFHFAWPKFVQSLWMEKEGGLAAVAYAPSVVKTPQATVRMTGNYPFGDDVRLEILAADGTEWPLFVRLPEWTANGRLAVNGVDVNGFIPGTFVRLQRTWRADDVVTIELPADVVYEKGNHDSVAVRRGPLIYCARVESTVKEIAKPDEKRGIREDRTGFPIREYRPTAHWNRVLCLPRGCSPANCIASEEANGSANCAVHGTAPTRAFPADPFVQGAVPCSIRVKAGFANYAGWGSMETGFTQRAVEPPPSPVASERIRDVSMLELVPLGATQTRITYLPWGRQ